jgi:voltage-gated potassium channel
MPINEDDRQSLVDAIERLSRWPLLVLSILMAFVLIASIFRPSPSLREADWAIWSIFAFQFALCLLISPTRTHFVRTHLVDLAVVTLALLELAVLALAVVIPVKVLTPAADTARDIGRLLRTGAAGGMAVTEGGEIRAETRREPAKLGQRVIGVVVVLALFTLPLIVCFSEKQPIRQQDSQIITVGDAYWWALATVTTVGYGDRVPLTAVGRGIGDLLMFFGITVYAGLIALLANAFRPFLLFPSQRDDGEAGTDVVRELGDIKQTLAKIEGLIRPPVIRPPQEK